MVPAIKPYIGIINPKNLDMDVIKTIVGLIVVLPG